ncbi:vWA domain-containing protein [[Pseudopropionibacterium] massiliense]|uniref:vWA domain-containing protein n=1 Tax=[Pseudopropionibacterium] massiliense TaxID=2220000 RepID=UPI0010314E6F|nr:VWA domain-containing protein [[Pseudopropionibacterium] massiliense]
MRNQWVGGLLAMALLVGGCGSPQAGESGAASAGNSGTPATTESSGARTSLPVVAVLDASGSMTHDDAGEGITRMAAAQQSVTSLFGALPAGTPAALVGYGTKMHGDDVNAEQGCADVEVVEAMAPVDATALKTKVDALVAGGWTPIGPALREAAAQLAGQPGRIVLVSDGKNTCESAPPCDVAKELKASNPGLSISVVSLRTDEEDVRCVARATDGYYTTADNGKQLASRTLAALDETKALAELSPSGAHGIGVGDTYETISGNHSDFPALSSGSSRQWNGQTVTVIVWRDCEWLFRDSELVAISSGEGTKSTPTVDGIALGDPVSKADEMLGSPIAEENEGADSIRIYPATQTALYWRLGSDAESRIRVVFLCRCAPDSEAMVMSFAGLGLYRIGDTNMVERGAMVPSTDPCEAPFATAPELAAQGVYFQLKYEPGGIRADSPLVEIHVGGHLVSWEVTSNLATYGGVKIGMTFDEVRRRHPDLRMETKNGNGGPFEAGVIRSGEREMIFFPDRESTSPSGSTPVVGMAVRDWSADLYGGC